MVDRKNFIVRGEHREALTLLSQEQKGDLLDAMFIYNLDEQEPELEGMVKMAFMFMKNSFDADREAYQATCKRNANNGKKGGRPRKKQEEDSSNGETPEENPEVSTETQNNPKNPVGLPETERFLEKPKKANTNTKSNTNTNTKNSPYIPRGDDSAEINRDFSREWEVLKNHWNSLGLPQYKKLAVNIPNFGEVKNYMAAYSLDEITMAIENYHRLLPRLPTDEPKYQTFFGFIRSGIDRFHDGAKPDDRYEKPEKKMISATKPAGKLDGIPDEEYEDIQQMFEEGGSLLKMAIGGKD